MFSVFHFIPKPFPFLCIITKGERWWLTMLCSEAGLLSSFPQRIRVTFTDICTANKDSTTSSAKATMRRIKKKLWQNLKHLYFNISRLY